MTASKVQNLNIWNRTWPGHLLSSYKCHSQPAFKGWRPNKYLHLSIIFDMRWVTVFNFNVQKVKNKNRNKKSCEKKRLQFISLCTTHITISKLWIQNQPCNFNINRNCRERYCVCISKWPYYTESSDACQPKAHYHLQFVLILLTHLKLQWTRLHRHNGCVKMTNISSPFPQSIKKTSQWGTIDDRIHDPGSFKEVRDFTPV